MCSLRAISGVYFDTERGHLANPKIAQGKAPLNNWNRPTEVYEEKVPPLSPSCL